MFRKLLICCVLLLCAATAGARTYRPGEVPNVQLADRSRFTSNPDGILSAGAVARIDSLCRALRTQGLAQVAVVAIDDIAGDAVFDFAIELFRSWGVGDARNDNGLGILLVKEQHEIRFVTGGGLEGVLPDAICKRIQTQFMLPHFREEDYDGGMTAGVGAVATVLVEGAEALPEEEEDLPGWVILITLLVVFGMPAALVYMTYCQQHRCPNCNRLSLELTGVHQIAGGVRYSTYRYTYRCRKCGHEHTRTSRVAHYPSDNSGGGPFIGGFGGFGGGSSGGSWGGGSFGGGGAGSRW